MDATDARRLPLAVLNKRRRRAVKLRERGMTLGEVASEVGTSNVPQRRLFGDQCGAAGM
jgi:hypothetical protein